VKLANGSFLIALAAVRGPPQPHGPHQEVRTNLSGLKKFDEKLSELLLFGLVFVPVVFALVFTGLL